MSEWFAEWFDTTYYHTLYNNRNEAEANAFVDKLLTHLDPNKDATFCDLACGKGRHAKRINEHGYSAIGLDLAPNSIAEAQQQANSTLQFYVHDMRQGFGANRFNYVTNLFTSFGYFDTLAENLKVLKHVRNALVNNGVFVIDFINVMPVLAQLPMEENKCINNLQFNIVKQVVDNHIVKHINVVDNGSTYYYKERLQAITHTQLTQLLTQAGFTVEAQFGNYNLEEFIPTQSPRIILIARK
jgi:SAM-dependent methyltransferase